MQRHDLNGVRNAQDLERKYDLASLDTLKRNYEIQKETLTKVENENNNILKSIIINLDGILESQSDISLWFFSGTPTLENTPYTEWENYDEHIGDIYYNKETGEVFIFKNIGDVMIWEKSESAELIRAMALSNAEVKLDNERKVFFDTPVTPYQNGDWYVKNNELYICQISRGESEKYSENDFILAVKYTDDTYAIGIGENLTILSGTVTEIRENVDKLNIKMTNTTQLVDEQGTKIGTLEEKTSESSQTVDEISFSISSISTNLNNNYTSNEELEQKLEEQKSSITTEMTTQMTQTAEGWKYDVINQINTEGITKLKNTTVNIDDDGVGVSKSDEGFVGLLSNKGVYASDGKIKEDNSNVLMKVDISGALFKTSETLGTIKENGLIQKEKIEHEKYGTCQAWYWVGD